MREGTKLTTVALIGACLLFAARACPTPPDPSAAALDSLVAVSDSLRARAESLDARPIAVDTVVLTRLRLHTDTLLAGPAAVTALVAAATPGDTLLCWPLAAFAQWREGLRASLAAERAEANATITLWYGRARSERALRADYQTLADSSLGLAVALQRTNVRLRRARVTIAPYVGVGIQSNGSAGLQIGIGLTYQRRRP
jgi:hypothetical protein